MPYSRRRSELATSVRFPVNAASNIAQTEQMSLDIKHQLDLRSPSIQSSPTSQTIHVRPPDWTQPRASHNHLLPRVYGVTYAATHIFQLQDVVYLYRSPQIE